MKPLLQRTAPALAVALLLAACAGPKKLPGDDQPTLASLGNRQITVVPDNLPVLAEEQTIAAYQQFLASTPLAPQAAQRSEALRRLGDLEMDLADRKATEGAGSEPDYKAAIARYQEYLKAHPQDPGNHRVLYQLARAQEQGGDLEAALKTLSSLVGSYPGTQHAEEAQFRRGELLFAMRNYAQAEAAYAAVLQAGQASAFQERALYMQGWSLFKQGKLEEGLKPFFGVLDLKLGSLQGAAREEADLAEIPALKRADRELVEDSFRVMSISLAGLQGAETVAPFITTPAREAYQFRVYGALGELYSRQERIKDAADTYALFVRRQPLHVQAPLLQARVIELYENNGFDTLALQAKKDHVLRYGVDSEFRRANPGGWQRVQPLVQTHLAQLAQHHHALAQRTKQRSDVQEAVRWYRTLLVSFPTDAQAPAQRFLLAELLFEDRQWADASAEYETVAYRHAGHPRASDAGYAALLSYAEQEKATPDAAARAELQRASVASALRFAQAFPADVRGAPVLTRAAEQLFALGDTQTASNVARQALALQPPPAPELRRTAWTVVAHNAFEQGRHAEAEGAYGEVLALSASGSPGRTEAAERLAASIYKQGEAARSGGDARAAVGHFERVAALGTSGVLSATSAVRASAQFDAAAALIGLKDWARAATALEDFRSQQPGHPLQGEVAPRLALAYLEQGRHSLAAAEFEKVSAAQSAPGGDATLARGALWQAAELHEKAARAAPVPAPVVAAAPPAATARRAAARQPAPPPRRTARAPAAAPVEPPLSGSTPLMSTALQAYERYVQRYPQPLETAVEARWRVAELLRTDGQNARALNWLRAVQQADAQAGEARTPLTRTLGGQATLALAEPVRAAYEQVALVEPLAQQLKLKKARLEEALRAYAAASEVGVAEVTTAATFHTASLYQDFGKALMTSARPKKLKKDELEQYNVMLEEQAFPFEEKAIELYETNARRTTAGLYDRWVQSSFTALAQLKPVRYGKTERVDPQLPAELPALQAALAQAQGLARAPLLNQKGVLQRRQGQFQEARQSFEAAMAADAAAPAPVLNLAILNDLYLGEQASALALYQRALELSPADAPTLGRWLAEIKARKPAAKTATATEDKPAAPATPAVATAPGTKANP
jgi:tetratricopeptide (TPR) repeat protein